LASPRQKAKNVRKPGASWISKRSPDPAMAELQQAHPLYAKDRDLVDQLLAVQVPADGHLVDLARLLSRYEGFPGAEDLRDDLAKTLRLWTLSRDELHQRTRAIWAGGYRPGAQPVAEAVGSGFDTADQDSP
jgi:hypothetical protein